MYRALFFLAISVAVTYEATAQVPGRLSPTPEDSLALLSRFSGTWHGGLTRHYNSGYWDLRLEIKPESTLYCVRYIREDNPELSCEGELVPERFAQGGNGTYLYLAQRLSSTDCLEFEDGSRSRLDFGSVMLVKRPWGRDTLRVNVKSGRDGHMEANGAVRLHGKRR